MKNYIKTQDALNSKLEQIELILADISQKPSSQWENNTEFKQILQEIKNKMGTSNNKSKVKKSKSKKEAKKTEK